MKKNLKIIILSIIVLATMTFEVIGMSTSFGSFYSYVVKPLIWIFIGIITYFFFKGDVIPNLKHKKEVSFCVIVTTLIYYAIYFCMGYVKGFAHNPYDYTLKGIINNLWIFVPIVIVKEYVRYYMINNSSQKRILLNALLISILFSAIISLIYAKSIKNNIQEIKIVTDKMMKLDKKTRLKVSSNDEVGELKQQINDLYSTLLRTIDDLEFKNKEILKLEKLKYDFFKGASHELKTPIASLKIILENMKYNIGKYKQRDIYINECIEIVDSLTKNISQILSVHSIENLNNDEEYLKINDTLEDILKKYEILANQKKITVNNYILDENIYIGKTALKIILSNLISNAVKYTDVNGVINIGIVNDWLYIENSYGNNKILNMDKIFDVKFDLNKENSNGLGLYIVSNILNNYNIEYKALQDEEFFIFKIKIFS